MGWAWVISILRPPVHFNGRWNLIIRLIGTGAVCAFFIIVIEISSRWSVFAERIEVGGFTLLLIPCSLTR